ncbi:MAG: hypothetical protein NTV55_05115 [Planctomycetota bacterium]|nr:hypothetical protein [Planctomycetota bacterium]
MAEHGTDQAAFLDEKLKSVLNTVHAGQGSVFFVDAAHGVRYFSLFTLVVPQRFVRAASGRQPFNVLGTWNAMNQILVAVRGTTVVNTGMMCELWHNIAMLGLTGSTLLASARQRLLPTEQGGVWFAAQLQIMLLLLPSYSPTI